MMKRVGVVFSGGEARGYAQFGAFKAIEEYCKKNNCEITSVVGTSFGAITASLISLGKTADELMEISKKLDLHLFRLADLNLNGQSLFKSKWIKILFQKYFDNWTFKDTKMDLFINTLDLKSGKEFIFSKTGLKSKDNLKIISKNFKVKDAVIASTSIPGVFPTKKINKFTFVDVGPLSPMGIDILDISKFDKIIIIDTSMRKLDFISKKETVTNIVKQYVSSLQKFYFNKKIDDLSKNKKIIIVEPIKRPLKGKSSKNLQEIVNKGYKETKKKLSHSF